MMIDFLVYINVFLIFYIYIGYLLLILLINFFLKKRDIDNQIYPTVTLMIAAYNEEKDIYKKLINSCELNYPKNLLKIIVVSDASSDDTDQIVNDFDSDNVQLLRVEGRVGKTHARNIAMKSNQSDITVFSDATTHYGKDSLRNLIKNFSDSTVGMVTGHLKYYDSKKTQMGIGQKLFWKYETLIKTAQTNLGTLTGSIGCITGFRTKLYSELPANVIEDFTGPLMIIKKGYRVVFESKAVCFEETTTKSKQEYSMRVRVIRGGLTGLLYAKEVLNPLKYPFVSFQLISHKLLRWLAPIFGISLFTLSGIAMMSVSPDITIKLIFFVQVLFYFCALLGFILEKFGIHNRILGIPLYFIVVNSASLVAIYKVLTSRLEATWETQR